MSEESPAEKQPARKQKMRALIAKEGTRIFLIALARKALDLVFEWLAS